MKIFKILIVVAIFLSFIPAVSAEGEFLYIDVDSEMITSEAVAQGAAYSAFDGEFNIQVPAGALKTGGRIEFLKLELAADSSMQLPNGYEAVSGIYEYQLRGTGFNKKFPLQLSMPYQSTLEFDKYLLIYDQKKQIWKEAISLTDLKEGIVTATVPFAQLKFVVVDVDTMTDGHASWYRYKKCMCAASPDFPKGTKLLVTNKNKNLSIVVKVNDWGPERDIFPLRVIDLDLVAFTKLATKGTGVMTNVNVVPFIAEKYDLAIVKQLLAGEALELAKLPVLAVQEVQKYILPVVEKVITPAVENIVPAVIDISQYYFLPNNK